MLFTTCNKILNQKLLKIEDTYCFQNKKPREGDSWVVLGFNDIPKGSGLPKLLLCTSTIRWWDLPWWLPMYESSEFFETTFRTEEGNRSDGWKEKAFLLHTSDITPSAKTGSYIHIHSNNWQRGRSYLWFTYDNRRSLLGQSTLLWNKTVFFFFSFNKKERWNGRHLIIFVALRDKRSKVLCLLPISHFDSYC